MRDASADSLERFSETTGFGKPKIGGDSLVDEHHVARGHGQRRAAIDRDFVLGRVDGEKIIVAAIAQQFGRPPSDDRRVAARSHGDLIR